MSSPAERFPVKLVISTIVFLALLASSATSLARNIRFATASNYASGASSPGCVASGDFNGDGYSDLVVTNHIQTVSVLINKGDGTFKPPVNYQLDFYFSGCVGVADFNSDKKPDLVIVGGDNVGNGVALLIGNGDGTFAGPSYTMTELSGASLSLAIGDLNKDGPGDLFVGGNGSSDTVFGDGKGHFQDGEIQVAYGFDVVLGDFNGGDVTISETVIKFRPAPGYLFWHCQTQQNQERCQIQKESNYPSSLQRQPVVGKNVTECPYPNVDLHPSLGHLFHRKSATESSSWCDLQDFGDSASWSKVGFAPMPRKGESTPSCGPVTARVPFFHAKQPPFPQFHDE